jgi:hypothetical protein
MLKLHVERLNRRPDRESGLSLSTLTLTPWRDRLTPMKTILTWGREGETFSYEGAVRSGTTIHYGKNFGNTAKISSGDYSRLLGHFSGREVSVGTSKDKPPEGSAGRWMKDNVTKSGLMSYVGAILIEEGYATKPRRGLINFKTTPKNRG